MSGSDGGYPLSWFGPVWGLPAKTGGASGAPPGPQAEQEWQRRVRPQRPSQSDFSRQRQARFPCQPQCPPDPLARGPPADTGRTRSRRARPSAGRSPGSAQEKGAGARGWSHPHPGRAERRGRLGLELGLSEAGPGAAGRAALQAGAALRSTLGARGRPGRRVPPLL